VGTKQQTQTDTPLDDYLTCVTSATRSVFASALRIGGTCSGTGRGPPRTRAGKKILYRKAAIAEWLRQEGTKVQDAR